MLWLVWLVSRCRDNERISNITLRYQLKWNWYCWANIHLVHYFETVVWKRKNQWYIVSVAFGARYLTGMVTSVPPFETFSLIKNNILHQSKNNQDHFENSNFWGMWTLGHVGHVTYSFIKIVFISTGIFVPQVQL